MRRVRVLSMGLMVAMFGLGAISLQSCGGDEAERTRERCEVCDGFVEGDCLRECRRFCLPDEEDCENRCTIECDQCKKDLSCQACASGCTGTTLRCAPVDELIMCEDGTFGEGDPASPVPTPSPGSTATPTP